MCRCRPLPCICQGVTGHEAGRQHNTDLLFLSLTGLRLRRLCELSLLSLLLSFFADSLSRSAAAASFLACMVSPWPQRLAFPCARDGHRMPHDECQTFTAPFHSNWLLDSLIGIAERLVNGMTCLNMTQGTPMLYLTKK